MFCHTPDIWPLGTPRVTLLVDIYFSCPRPRGMGLFSSAAFVGLPFCYRLSSEWCKGPSAHAHWLGRQVLVPPPTRHATSHMLSFVVGSCASQKVVFPATGGQRGHAWSTRSGKISTQAGTKGGFENEAPGAIKSMTWSRHQEALGAYKAT